MRSYIFNAIFQLFGYINYFSTAGRGAMIFVHISTTKMALQAFIRIDA